jgi:integrase
MGTSVKAVKLLSAIFNFAIKKGWAEVNPCYGVEKPADGRRDRFLKEDEYARLGMALDEAREMDLNQNALNAIKLTALTGCRKSEVLGLRVSEVDFNGNCLRLSDTKTGAQMRPCGNIALQLLKEIIGSANSDYVFPTHNGDGHLTDISRIIAQVRELSGLSDFTLHILRHSYATVAHELGYSELTISGLLGHSQGTVTSRYAHHVDHALASASDRVSETISGRMNQGW